MNRRFLELAGALVVLSAVTMAHAGNARAEPPPVQGPPTVAADARININEAQLDELVALPGIGPSRAEAIIVERGKRPFRRVEDIMRVPGIGRKTYLRIRSRIRVR
jgi:competence protein ComEA